MWGPSDAEFRFFFWFAATLLVSFGVSIGLLIAWVF